jgi:hypothetical protein
VVELLKNVPPGAKPNPRYFFWSGNGLPKTAVPDWHRAYRRLFEVAALMQPDRSATTPSESEDSGRFRHPCKRPPALNPNDTNWIVGLCYPEVAHSWIFYLIDAKGIVSIVAGIIF